MAIPRFGYLKIEAFACLLMVVAGTTGLLFVVTGSSDRILGVLWKQWPAAHIHPVWLTLQAVAVIAGGIGAWQSRSFLLAAIGVVLSLIVRTAVGRISWLPGLLMFFLISARFRAFDVFLPRWRGQGPPPPGVWRS